MKRIILGLPAYGWLGIGLAILFWILSWSLTGLRTHWCFFPQWLGFCLIVDALVFLRRGTSMLNRSPRAYVMLFFTSIPGWWLFELLNLRTQNWRYLGAEHFTDVQYAFLASLSFSTVMPAVFGAAELASTFDWVKRRGKGLRISSRPRTVLAFFLTGCLMLLLLLMWPRYFFPFVWISVFFILEPVNVALKNRTLFQYTDKGDWRPIISLWVGCLICAFFWEMWNFYAYPKWVYQVPCVDFWHIFEMPILGYGGYIPFALELFALYHLIVGIVKPAGGRNFVQVSHHNAHSV